LAAFAAEKPWLMQALDAEMAVRGDSLRANGLFFRSLRIRASAVASLRVQALLRLAVGVEAGMPLGSSTKST
jgi:hypothetical protein